MIDAIGSYPKIPGFRLGIYVFKDAEIVDYAAPYGVFSVARRFDPGARRVPHRRRDAPGADASGLHRAAELQLRSIAPTWTRSSSPAASARARRCITGACTSSSAALPEKTLITSVCTGSWIYGAMGLLDGKPATNRKEPDRLEASNFGKVPIDRLAEIAPACRISRARVVDAGRIITAGGIASGMEMGFHLLRRAGYDEATIAEVARVMEYGAPTSSTATTSNTPIERLAASHFSANSQPNR